VPSSIVSLNRGILTTSTSAGIWADFAADLFASSGASLTSSDTFSSAVSLVSKLLISSPWSPIIASKLSTTAVSPSATPIWSRYPSLKDSNSIVALSVSISAITSPAEISSPSFTSHLAKVPSVIVGESAGMRIWIVINSTLSFALTRLPKYLSKVLKLQVPD
jgi:hypothetical protein